MNKGLNRRNFLKAIGVCLASSIPGWWDSEAAFWYDATGLDTVGAVGSGYDRFCSRFSTLRHRVRRFAVVKTGESHVVLAAFQETVEPGELDVPDAEPF